MKGTDILVFIGLMVIAYSGVYGLVNRDINALYGLATGFLMMILCSMLEPVRC